MIKVLSKKKIGILLPLLTLLCLVLFSQSFIALGATSNHTKKLQEDKQSEELLVPSKENMMETIKALCASSREYGSKSEKKACDYLDNKFKSYGFTPYIQKFKRRDKQGIKVIKSQNLIAVKKNTTKTSKGIIIICAHYDSDKNSLGANDNASGCSVILETARLLKNVPSDYEIRFVLFGMEKYFNAGSNEYVGKLSEKEKQHVKGVIDIDSIAQKNNVNPIIYTVSGNKNTATAFITNVKENKNLTIIKSKTYREYSDYSVFDNYVLPALCIGQPYSEKLNNNNKDSISQIDKSKLVYVVNIILNSLK